MNSERIAPFIALGNILREISNTESKEIYESATQLASHVPRVIRHNGWFDEDNVNRALAAIANMLRSPSLQQWIENYDHRNANPQRVGVLLAGNIPLVGFHDFLCVLTSGNTFVGKLSSKDDQLLPLLANLLVEIEPGLSSRIEFTDGVLEKIDALIATGSDNTSTHIEYYFGQYPNIIRKNRNAVAV
ncbi:MAG: hypothetical protein JKY18_02365 [Flavobacteriales bacterium]|nr:hypothetical protein [Flavobacteriales bacterium]